MLLGKLEVKGFSNTLAPNIFIKQDTSEHLAIIFPGLGYNADMPLLYYTTQLLIDKGADLLQLRYNYQTDETQSLSQEEQYQRLITDCTAAYDVATQQRNYSGLTLVGKSLGTLALGHLLTTRFNPANTTFVWLTPLLRNEHLYKQINSRKHRSLFVIGTKDSHYDPSLLAETEQATGGETLVIEGANHSLERAGKPLESPGIVQSYLERLATVLEQ